MLTVPASIIAQTDVGPGRLRQPPPARGPGCEVGRSRSRVERRVQVDRVRHHRRAQHGRRPAARFQAVEPRAPARPPRSGRRWRGDEQARQEPDRDDQQEAGDHPLERPLTAPVLHGQQHRATPRRRSGRPAAAAGRTAGTARSRRRSPRRGRWPSRPPRPATSSPAATRPARAVADQLRQRHAGRQAELGGQELHHPGHRVGDDQHPDQQVAVPGAGLRFAATLPGST